MKKPPMKFEKSKMDKEKKGMKQLSPKEKMMDKKQMMSKMKK